MGAGSPSIRNKKDAEIFLEENGRRPSWRAIQVWMKSYDWYGRADIINAQAIQVANEQIVIDKAGLLRKQYLNAAMVADRAIEYLVSGTFDSSASAVSAIRWASEEQRRVIGISEVIEKMAKMSDTELQREILDRIRRATEAGQIIDGELEDSEISEEDSS